MALKIPRIVRKSNYFFLPEKPGDKKVGPMLYSEMLQKLKEKGIKEHVGIYKGFYDADDEFHPPIVEKVKAFYIVGDQEGKRDLSGPIFDRKDAAAALVKAKEGLPKPKGK